MRRGNIRNGIWRQVLLTLLILINCSYVANAEGILTVEVNTNLERALPGVRIYAFTEAGGYTGKYGTTDSDGVATFNIDDFAEGIYKFRMDYLGGQFWSETCHLPEISTVHMVLDEENVPVTISKGDDFIAGVRVYLFSDTGSYLGQYRTTDNSEPVFFSLPVDRTFKFRVDYIGYKFWTENTLVAAGSVVEFDIPHKPVTITVNSEFNIKQPISNVRVYLYTSAGSYMGSYQTTNENGQVSFNLPGMSYKVRADVLGQKYFSEDIIWENKEINIQMGQADILVSGGGQALPDVRVYVYNSSRSYLNQYADTGADGKTTFILPAGDYLFRADYQGSQFWSNQEALGEGETKSISVSTGGGSFELTVLKDERLPLSGVKCYAFNSTGAYLGMYGTTNDEGTVSFECSDGSYKFRIDYMGYQFWTDVYQVPEELEANLFIQHKDVAVTAKTVFQALSEPVAGCRVYLFSSGGAYLNTYGITDENGQVVFNLPEKAYKVRVDYLSQQFFSDEMIQEDTDVNIPVADAEIMVLGCGEPLEGVRVYAYTSQGAYLSIYQSTGSEGKTTFRLPVQGEYKFRADYQSSQFWSENVSLEENQVTPVQVSTGGGVLSYTVLKETDKPLSGVKCYVFTESGSYLNLNAITDNNGNVTFNLADGVYKIRTDYLGYQFFSNLYTISGNIEDTFFIPHKDVIVSVEGVYQETYDPLENIRVYLYTESGSYMNQYQTTDENGTVTFNLPEVPCKVRADYMNQHFWSDSFVQSDISVAVKMGDILLNVSDAGVLKEGAKVYVYSDSGSYLNLYGVSDSEGNVLFTLPQGNYKFRIDFEGEQYWTWEKEILADVVNNLPFNFKGTIHVPEAYSTIQEAISNALEGETVLVDDGLYVENILMDKFVVLQSVNGPSRTSIQAFNYDDNAITITAENCMVKGFTIYGATEDHFDMELMMNVGGYGIHISQSDNCKISNNTFGIDETKFNERNIRVIESNNVEVSDNIFQYAISHAAYISYADFLIFKNNRIVNNRYGLALGHTNHATVSNNFCSDTYGDGLNIYACLYTTMIENITQDIRNHGICLYNSRFSYLRGNQLLNRSRFMVSVTYTNDPELYYEHDIDTSNTVDGIPVYYLLNQSNLTFTGPVAFIGLIHCDNVSISNVEAVPAKGRLLMIDCSDVSVNESSFYDINMRYTEQVDILNSTISDGGAGLWLYDSTDVYCSGNIFGQGASYILGLNRSQNNIFINNIFSGKGDKYSRLYFLLAESNTFYLNTFQNITFYGGTTDVALNNWISPEPILYEYDGATYLQYLGNFYLDHDLTDSDGDGITDSAFAPTGDLFPLAATVDSYSVQ